MLYKVSEYTSQTGRIYIQSEDLVGTGRNWTEGASILGIEISDFLSKIKREYSAELTPYRRDGELIYVGFYWTDLAKARKYKNYINRCAREKSYQI
ncbi:MAG: hypothetical protein RR744_08305 [Cellulosilyticaceae bacterium]